MTCTGDFDLKVLKDNEMLDILIVIATMIVASNGIPTIVAGGGIRVTGSSSSRTIAATGGGTGRKQFFEQPKNQQFSNGCELNGFPLHSSYTHKQNDWV